MRKKKLRFNKMLKNALGFTLVEVMVAAGLLGGLSLVTVQLSQKGKMASKTARTDAMIYQMMGKMHNIFEEVDNCTQTLTGRDFTGTEDDIEILWNQGAEYINMTATTPPGTVYFKLDVVDGKQTGELTHTPTQEKTSRFSLSELRFEKMGATLGMVSMKITKLTGLGKFADEQSHLKRELGGQTFTKYIPVRVNDTSGNNKVDECTTGLSSLKDTMVEEACYLTGGSEWNDAQKKCTHFPIEGTELDLCPDPNTYPTKIEFITTTDGETPKIEVSCVPFGSDASGNAQTCPANQFLTGFDSDGIITCDDFCSSSTQVFLGRDASSGDGFCYNFQNCAGNEIAIGVEADSSVSTNLRIRPHCIAINCPTGSYLTGITRTDLTDSAACNGVAGTFWDGAQCWGRNCIPLVDDVNCAAGSYVTSVDSNGVPTCAVAQTTIASVSLPLPTPDTGVIHLSGVDAAGALVTGSVTCPVGTYLAGFDASNVAICKRWLPTAGIDLCADGGSIELSDTPGSAVPKMSFNCCAGATCLTAITNTLCPGLFTTNSCGRPDACEGTMPICTDASTRCPGSYTDSNCSGSTCSGTKTVCAVDSQHCDGVSYIDPNCSGSICTGQGTKKCTTYTNSYCYDSNLSADDDPDTCKCNSRSCTGLSSIEKASFCNDSTKSFSDNCGGTISCSNGTKDCTSPSCTDAACDSTSAFLAFCGSSTNDGKCCNITTSTCKGACSAGVCVGTAAP